MNVVSKNNKNIKIGDNNKIKNSNIGHFKNFQKNKSLFSKFSGWILKILATVTAGVILNWLLQLLNLK